MADASTAQLRTKVAQGCLPRAADAPQGCVAPGCARLLPRAAEAAPRPCPAPSPRSVDGMRAEVKGGGRKGNARRPLVRQSRKEVGVMGVVDEELERLRAEVSCAVVLEKSPEGWTLDKEESTKRCLKYRSGARIVMVNHEGRGWWDPGSEAKGDVFALVQHLDRRLNFGQVRQALRKYIG